MTKYLMYKLPEGKDVPSSWWTSVRGIRDQLSFACLWWPATPYVLTLWWPLRIVLPAGDWLEGQHTRHMVVVVASYIQTIIAPVTAQVTCLALAAQDILKCTRLPHLSGALSQALGFSGSMQQHSLLQDQEPKLKEPTLQWPLLWNQIYSVLAVGPRLISSCDLLLSSHRRAEVLWHPPPAEVGTETTKPREKPLEILISMPGLRSTRSSHFILREKGYSLRGRESALSVCAYLCVCISVHIVC